MKTVKPQTAVKQTVKLIPTSTATPVKKEPEPKKQVDPMLLRFGTADPLKIADAILKKKFKK